MRRTGPEMPLRGVEPFVIKDCALITLATGRKTHLLQVFRNEISRLPAACIYHHFWGGLLQPRFEEREYNNDFAAWVRHGIHDAVLAERLSVLSPSQFPDLETLRGEIVELIDQRFYEVEHLVWARATQQFEFMQSQTVVFNTGRRLFRPDQLAHAISDFSLSSVFYHFIEARRHTLDRQDDFSNWLSCFGHAYEPVVKRLASIDPFFGNLNDLRAEIIESICAGMTESAQ